MSIDGPLKDLPLNRVALLFGVLSIPLAFTRHLVSLAVVLALLALVLGALGRWLAGQRPGVYAEPGMKRARWALWSGGAGALCAMLMWWLWASNVLLR